MSNIKDINPKIKDIIKIYGVNPKKIGKRNRGWWVVDKIEEEENNACAEIGDLCIKTRDGNCDPIDTKALKIKNFVGTSNGSFDCTYLYYYYRKKNIETLKHE